MKWETRRFDWRADLGHGLELLVSYEGNKSLVTEDSEGGYNVTVFGRRLKTRSPDVRTKEEQRQ